MASREGSTDGHGEANITLFDGLLRGTALDCTIGKFRLPLAYQTSALPLKCYTATL